MASAGQRRWANGPAFGSGSLAQRKPWVGRIRREQGTDAVAALKKAKAASWWRDGLVLDSRDAKFWVWREP